MNTWIDRFARMSPEERAMTVAEDPSTFTALVNEAAVMQDWYRRWRLARDADPPTQPDDLSGPAGGALVGQTEPTESTGPYLCACTCGCVDMTIRRGRCMVWRLEGLGCARCNKADPPALVALGERLRTQDNQMTAHPIFVVEHRNDARRPWEFVTACLTDEGARAYMNANGHNLRKFSRIFVHSGYRNDQWIGLRNHLMALPAAPPVTDTTQGAGACGVTGRATGGHPAMTPTREQLAALLEEVKRCIYHPQPAEEDNARKKIDHVIAALSTPPPAALAAPPPASGSPLPLEHLRTCSAGWDDTDCTCGLSWRIRLATEQEMHNAWRKRAEEAEAREAACALCEHCQQPMACPAGTAENIAGLELLKAQVRVASPDEPQARTALRLLGLPTE